MIKIILYCPECHHQHIDRGKWAITAHKSHLCEFCGTIWRPCDQPTVGVESIETVGKDDTWFPD